MHSKVFTSRNGAVAAEHPLASMAALEALRAGGNAVDAAVAASFSLPVLNPHLNGLGGDFFALCYQADSGKVYCLNSSGWAPSGLTVDAIKSKGYRSVPDYGPYSIVVPGHVKGIHRMHEKFGNLEFPKLLASAIKFAQEGFPIHHGLSKAIHMSLDSFPAPAKNAFAPHGRPPRPGELIKQPNLARVLKAIAEQGPEIFYDGWIAEKIVAELSRHDVSYQLEDFGSFEPEWREPLSVDYRGFKIYEVPPNSMGATTLLILKSLEQVELKRFKPNAAERIETTIKIVKEAYGKRDRELGDPRFVEFDLTKFLFPDESGGVSGSTSKGAIGGDTTYFAILDAEGNIVSGIQSLFHHFGSKVFVEDCGFFLNNRGSAFKLEGPNRLEPRKRPLHTLSALLVASGGEVKAAMGCSGGEYRPQQHALFITNLVDYSMSLEDTLGFPRFLWDSGSRVLVEQGFTNLDSLGHEVEVLEYPGRTGVAQGVENLNGIKKAVCDVRGEGIPMGL